jgi:hypothetical protein
MHWPSLQKKPAAQLVQAQGLATQAPATQDSHSPQRISLQASFGGQLRWQVIASPQDLSQGTIGRHWPPLQNSPSGQVTPLQGTG